jgi:hypothetical protein
VQRLNVITLHLLAPALSPDQLHTIEVVEECRSALRRSAKHGSVRRVTQWLLALNVLRMAVVSHATGALASARALLEKLSCIAKHLSRPPRQSLATVAEEASAASESKAEHRTQAKHKPRRRHAAGPPSSADAKAEFKAQILRRIAGDVGSSESAA